MTMTREHKWKPIKPNSVMLIPVALISGALISVALISGALISVTLISVALLCRPFKSRSMGP